MKYILTTKNPRNLRNPRINICFSSSLWPSLFSVAKLLILVPISVHSWFQRIKNMKNKVNFNSVKLTATSYSERAYNDLSPKTQNGTKPNKPNLKPISNTIKPSLFSEESANPQNLFFAKRTQFQGVKSVASNCYRKVYNALQSKGNEPKRTQLKPIKPNPNPIKANFPAALLSTFYRSTLSGQRPAAQFRLTSGAISVTVIPLSNSIRKEYNLILRSPCYV